jgi:uncharacterized protein (UPF0261 family)
MALKNKTCQTGACKVVDGTVENTETTKAKIDTSGLAKALQSIIGANMPQTTVTTVNPAKFMSETSARMLELYDDYDKLKILGKQLNGRLLSDQIPDTLKIEKVQIVFRTVEDGKTSEPVTADIRYISSVGDISGLISTELGSIIMFLQQESAAVLDIIGKTKEQVEKARKSWEEANKDKKIQEFTPEMPAQEPTPEPATP